MESYREYVSGETDDNEGARLGDRITGFGSRSSGGSINSRSSLSSLLLAVPALR